MDMGNNRKFLKKLWKSTKALLPVTSLLKDQRYAYKNLFFLNNFLKMRKSSKAFVVKNVRRCDLSSFLLSASS